MTIPARISIVTLGVEDVARSAAFYEALGWGRASSSMDEIVWFIGPDGRIEISLPSIAARTRSRRTVPVIMR